MTTGEFKRLERGWTQQQLSALTGVNRTYISLIERGRLIPTDDQLAKLAKALEISPASMLMQPVVLAEQAVAS